MLTRLAALVLALCCLTGSPASATPFDELPAGPPTTLPWWQHGRLHVGDTVIERRKSDLVSRSGTTLVATDELRRAGRDTTWFLVDGDRLERLPMEATSPQPLVSADGRWVAWLEVRARRVDTYKRTERYRVVLYDVANRRVASALRDKRRVAWEDGINGIWLRTLSNDGRLLLSQGSDGPKVLSPGRRAVDFGGPRVNDGVSLDGWPGGTTMFRAASDTSVYGTLGRAGLFERAGSFTAPGSGLWSADGSRYVYEDDDEHWVRPIEGEPVRLDVPEDVLGLRVVGWESADAMVLWSFQEWTDEQTSYLVRCSATTGACERTSGPRAGAYATMPSRY